MPPTPASPAGRATGGGRARPTPDEVPAGTHAPRVDDLIDLGREAGLDAVGVAGAGTFTSTRQDLEERKARGLHGGMRFTYRNPARSTEPARALAGARALVVGARSYLRSPPEPDGDRPRGRVARYAWSDHYGALRASLEEVAAELRRHGWQARVLVDDNALVDREAARRAGLGWYGKNANLLVPGAGSFFVLGSVLTDAPLPATDPQDLPPDGCGPCTRCLDSCPTGAIVTPGVVDARRCLAWLLQDEGPFPREHRVALGDRIYGCDDCQEVCPPTRVTVRRAAREEGGASDDGAADVGQEAWVDLLDMLELDDDDLLARHGRWYIPRRQPRHLRRNALVALGNVADPGDGRVIAALRRTLADGDPLVRAHAVWASRRLGRDDLLAEAGTGDDPDPGVRDELSAPVPPR